LELWIYQLLDQELFEIDYHVGKLLKIQSYCNFFIPNFISISGAHQIKTRITHLYQAGRAKIHEKLNPTDLDECSDKLLKFTYDNYIITRNYQDYLNRVKPSKKKLLLNWTCVLILWITFVVTAIAFLYNRAHKDSQALIICIILGLPTSFFPNGHVLLMTFSFGLFLGAYSRLITVIIDGRNQLEILDITRILRDPILRGKLRSKYYSKMCLIYEMLILLMRVFQMTPILVLPLLIFSQFTRTGLLVLFSHTPWSLAVSSGRL